MFERVLGPASGKLVDIAPDANGFTYVYQDEALGTLVLGACDREGLNARLVATETIGGANSWPVVARWANETWVAWRTNSTLEGTLWNVTTDRRWRLGVVHGNYPIAIDHGYVAWLCDASFTVRRTLLSALVALDTNDASAAVHQDVADLMHGTGIAYALPLTSVDENRPSVVGMANPRAAGGLTVGENTSGQDRNIVRDSRGNEINLWPGQFSPLPRIAFYDSGHIAVATSQGTGVRVNIFDYSELAPPVVVPTIPPDIAWTPDPTRTVDMLEYVLAAATAVRHSADGRKGDLWLHKSQERPNWGENWHFDDTYIGFVEDRSTGTRMVSMVRPKVDGHTNTTRNRLSPEDVLAMNAAGANLGDPLTLPLAGYTWRGNHPWMVRHVTGRAIRTFHTDYVWWDEPQYGGVWEIWAKLPLTIEVVTGYARMNGHDVFALTRYGKPSGNEWNAWGPHGWIAFLAFNADGTEELAARRVAPPEQRASPLTAPFVEARFPTVYPIYDAALEAPVITPPKEVHVLPNDDQMLNAMRRIHVEGYHGELQRAGGIFEAPDPPASQIFDPRFPIGAHVIDDYSLSVWTGRYVRYFSENPNASGGPHEFAIRSVIRDLHNSDEARAKRGDIPPAGTLAGPLSIDGRDFVTP